MPQVLIVDDDEAVRRLLELLLNTSGYDTVTATNGVEALEQMRRQLPCVVLLDMNIRRWMDSRSASSNLQTRI